MWYHFDLRGEEGWKLKTNHTQAVNHVYVTKLQRQHERASLIDSTPLCIAIHCCLEKLNTAHDFAGRGHLEALHMDFFLFGILLHASLSLDYFNLYPFTVINYNHEYNSFPWVLWVLLTNYHIWGWSWESISSEVGVKSSSCLEGFPEMSNMHHRPPTHPTKTETSFYIWKYF